MPPKCHNVEGNHHIVISGYKGFVRPHKSSLYRNLTNVSAQSILVFLGNSKSQTFGPSLDQTISDDVIIYGGGKPKAVALLSETHVDSKLD